MEEQNNQGKVLVSALKVRKLLLKFLKNSKCRIVPFAVSELNFYVLPTEAY
jgi:hypothetical protein